MIDGAEIKRRREALGMTQPQLAKAAGVTQPLISGLEAGSFRQTKFLHEIALALHTTPAAISIGIADQNAAALADNDLIPIYSVAWDEIGHTNISRDPVDFTNRPKILEHAKGLYGFFVLGTTMQPEFEPGDIVIINPSSPAVAGNPVLVLGAGSEEYTRCRWGRFVRIGTDFIDIKHHSPSRPEETNGIRLPRKEWLRIHRIVIRIMAR